MNEKLIEEAAQRIFAFDWPKDKWDRLGPGYHQDRYKGMARAALTSPQGEETPAAPARQADVAGEDAELERLRAFRRFALDHTHLVECTLCRDAKMDGYVCTHCGAEE